MVSRGVDASTGKDEDEQPIDQSKEKTESRAFCLKMVYQIFRQIEVTRSHLIYVSYFMEDRMEREKERLFKESKSSKDCTWSAVPDALLGVIS